MFLLGCPKFTILVDHKPLIPILSDKRLDKIENPRLVNLKEKTLSYSFDIEALPGKLNTAADARSPYPVHEPDSEDNDLANEVEINTVRIAVNRLSSTNAPSTTIEDIRKAAEKDEQYQLLLEKVKHNTFAATQNAENQLIQPFFNVKDRLSISDDLLMYCYQSNPYRLVIPLALRRDIIENLHIANQGGGCGGYSGKSQTVGLLAQN